MYNLDKLINIINKAKGQYSLNEFARISDVDSAYLSRILNRKKNNPPSPKILRKIANASKGVTTYEELMDVCGYITNTNINNNLLESSHYVPIPLFNDIEEYFLYFDYTYDEALNIFNHIYLRLQLKEEASNYFAYKINDKSMYPLFSIDDIAILKRTNNYENGKTHLISLDNESILIRKILENENGIELHAMNPYFPIINLTNEEIDKRDFTILGRVIKAENKSAFE